MIERRSKTVNGTSMKFFILLRSLVVAASVNRRNEVIWKGRVLLARQPARATTLMRGGLQILELLQTAIFGAHVNVHGTSVSLAPGKESILLITLTLATRSLVDNSCIYDLS